MAQSQEAHARAVVARFAEMLGEQGAAPLADEHFESLVLLIESAIDAAVLAATEEVANQLERMAHQVRNSAEHFSAG